MSAPTTPQTGPTTDTPGGTTAPERPVARPADGYAGDLTPQQAWDLLAADPDAVLVDVRTDAEWRFVGTPDVSSLGKHTVLAQWVTFSGQPNQRFLAELAEAGLSAGSGRSLVFLCRSGARSVGAARAATAAGLGSSYNVLEGFEGGLDLQRHRGGNGWRAAGLPWTQS